jgi:hypothetical protein
MGSRVSEAEMYSMNSQTLLIVVIVAVIVVGVAAWLIYQKRQSKRLEQRFGPEYGAVVDELGSQAKAETELKKREKRVERLDIVPLSPTDAARFAQAWIRLQGSFIDDPKGVLIQADQLVRELLVKRGYPMTDFEHRAADISVDHPGVVSNYRAAQLIVARDQRGEADTEELRKAVVHFRALFDELLGTTTVKDRTTQATTMVTQS